MNTDVDTDLSNSPQDLVAWLEKKHARHGEDEDRQAAELLKQLLADKPANGDRALVATCKKQAKRLLRMTKDGPLKITALNEALGVMAQLHGYPTWDAMARSTKPAPEAPQREADGGEREVPVKPAAWPGQTRGMHFHIQPKTHATALQKALNLAEPGSCFITPHAKDLVAGTHRKDVKLVTAKDIGRRSPLLCPLGTRALLPEHSTLVMRFLNENASRELPYGAGTGTNEIQQIQRMLEKWFLETREKNLDRLWQDHKAKRAAPGDFPALTAEGMDQIHGTTVEDAIYDALEKGMTDVAYRIHATTVPSLAGFGDFLSNLENWRRDAPHQTIWHAILNFSLHFHQEAWDFQPTDVLVIEVDPCEVDAPVDASTRWDGATMIAALHRSSSLMTHKIQHLAEQAYNDPGTWLKIIPAKCREAVVTHHARMANATEKRVVLLDEMDGPIRNERLLYQSMHILNDCPPWGGSVAISTRALLGQTPFLLDAPRHKLPPHLRLESFDQILGEA